MLNEWTVPYKDSGKYAVFKEQGKPPPGSDPSPKELIFEDLHSTSHCPGGSDSKESTCNAGDLGSSVQSPGQEEPL